MLERKTVINQIEILADGHVQVRFAKQVLDDGELMVQEWHRTVFPPGSDVGTQMIAVNNHLDKMRAGAVSAADIARIERFCMLAWE